MTKITWTGPDMNKIAAQIELQAGNKKIQAVLALADAVDHGTLALQDFLEAAITKTGLAREADGLGFPGRHRSGQMVGSISNNTERPQLEAHKTVMAFGWFAGEFQAYFRDQDLHIGGPEKGAHAMRDAALAAIDRMKMLMLEWEKGDLVFDE